MLAIFESIARVGIAILVNGLWQGALIAFVAWLTLRLFSRANASTRYAVWALALAAVVVVPVATSLSRVSVTSPQAGVNGSSPQHKVAMHSVDVHRTAITRQGDTSPVVAAASVPNERAVGSPTVTHALARPFDFAVPTMAAAVLFGLWSVVSIVVLMRLGVALFALERLKRDALPLGMEYRETMPRWDGALKGHRDVRLCVSDEIEVPVAIGLFDAMILLPAHLIRTLEPPEIDQISLHELAHLLRADDWTNGLQRIATALLFFNPAVLFIARQLDIEREVACDDFVLQLIGSVKPYAFCLTKMAEMTAWPHRALPAPGVFVTRKNISIRIERLLRTGRAIGSSIAPGVAATLTVALIAIFFVLRTMTPSIAFTEIPPIPELSSTAIPTPAPLPSIRKIVVKEYKAIPPPHAIAELPPVPHFALQKRVALAIAEVNRTISRSAVKSEVTSSQGAKPSKTSECVGCDYSGAALANKDFSNRSMEGTNFSRADLHGSTFDHATLTGVNFANADLRNVSFVGANLEGCNMRNAQLAGARFDGAMLMGCNIDASALSPAQARIVLTSCEGCNFAHVNLRGMDLRKVHIEGANLAYADLRDADLSGAMFTGVNFSHALLSGARVDDTDFTGCNFSRADLRNVDLSKASMTGSVLGNAIMRN